MKEKASIFDFLSGLTEKKIKWDDWSETDQKQFSSFMVIRWLSMNTDLLEFVNDMQEFTSRMDKREVYKLYLYILPKMKFYFKYIKRNETLKFDTELVDYIKKYFEVCEREAKEYLEIFNATDPDNVEISGILSKYGLDEKKIKKLLKK